MRNFFAVCCLFLALCLLCACGQIEATATDQLSDLLSIPGVSPPDANIYFAGGDPATRLDEIVEPLYGTTAETLQLLADYAVLLGRSTELYEIHILRVNSLSDVPIVKRLLVARANAICLATEEGHPTEHNAIVYVNGDTLYLFATPYNHALKQSVAGA